MTLIDEQIIRMHIKDLHNTSQNYKLTEEQLKEALHDICEILDYLLKKDGVLK